MIELIHGIILGLGLLGFALLIMFLSMVNEAL